MSNEKLHKDRNAVLDHIESLKGDLKHYSKMISEIVINSCNNIETAINSDKLASEILEFIRLENNYLKQVVADLRR